MGLNPGMGNSVARNKEFPSIRQRELQAWRDIMCSLYATESLLIFREMNTMDRFREAPQVYSYLS